MRDLPYARQTGFLTIVVKELPQRLLLEMTENPSVTRNAPTASYAALTPEFHLKDSGVYAGGQFLDGRASTLEDQAGGPTA